MRLGFLAIIGLFLAAPNAARAASSTGPGSGVCARRDFASTSAPGSFGSANSEITFSPALGVGLRGAEIDNNTSFDLYVSVATAAANCTGGVANVAVPANSSRFLQPGDQKFGTHICARRQDGSTLSTGTLTVCAR